MTYATVIVHVELGHLNAGLLQIAGDIAERFHAGVIGIAACRPMQIVFGEGYVSRNLIEQDREENEKEPAKIEKIRLVLAQGEASAAILEFTRHNASDLIAPAWRDSLEPERALTIRRVIRHGSCPVIVFRV